MPVSNVLEQFRLSRTRTVSAVGLVAVTGAATLALGLSPAPAPEQPTASAAPDIELVSLSAPATGVSLRQGSLREQSATAYQRAQTDVIEAEQEAAAERASKAKRQVEAERRAEQDRQRAARQRTEAQLVAAGKQAATRAERSAVPYPDNLDGWIREAMAIMEREGIPGTYHGIHRNIMRESSGNP
ncbi:MAG TPA: lytic transglycosylase, partial [Streptomyces sp.]|nr:lytic transglycosylase [Streptomyces sp.]